MVAELAALLLASVQLSGCSAPTRAKVVSLEKPLKKAQTRTGQRHHRVRKGDTLYTIAWRYGLDFPELASYNNIGPPYTIYPGQTLRLFRPSEQAAHSRQGVKRTYPVKPAEPARKAPPKSAAVRQPLPKQASSPGRAAAGEEFGGRKRLDWEWPTSGKLEQRFSNVDPSRKGIQISGRNGQSVVAAESGKVVYAGSGLIGYGRLIIIKHNKNYLSAYGHNRKLLVTEGSVVKKGELIAEMGKKGGGRPTLHFEIRRNGTPVNPMKLLPRRR